MLLIEHNYNVTDAFHIYSDVRLPAPWKVRTFLYVDNYCGHTNKHELQFLIGRRF